MSQHYRKKIMILGANPETLPIVQAANDMGLETVVLDPNIGSPAKQAASISVTVDALDVAAVCEVARKLQVDAVLVGVADTLVASYFDVCHELGFPCYVSHEAQQSFSSKKRFCATVVKFGISTTPQYSVSDIVAASQSMPLKFPILVKPDDNGGGVGITVCYNAQQAVCAIEKAQSFSKSGEVLVEEYMTANDFFVYYEIVDGKPYLLATADRFKSEKQTVGSPVCIGAVYPSRHEREYVISTHEKVTQMLQGLKVERGIFCLQFFKDARDFFAYDPGFRFQGEGVHFHIQHAYSIDQRKGLIDYSIGKAIPDYVNELENVRVGANNFPVTVWVLLSEGMIDRIVGMELLKDLRSYKSHIERFRIGDCVTDAMQGTEKQVFARIYLQHEEKRVILEDLQFINENLKVLSKTGNMILDMLECKKLEEIYISREDL